MVQKTSNLSMQLIKIKSRNSSFIAGLKLLLRENVQRFTSYSYTYQTIFILGNKYMGTNEKNPDQPRKGERK